MLNKETKKKLKGLGFDVDALVAAVTHADEQEFSVPEIKTYTDEELATRDENSKKAGWKEGKKSGVDIAVKQIAKKLGLDENMSDPDDLSEAISKVPSKSDNEQIALLQKRAEKAEQERDVAQGETKTAKRDAELLSSFPSNRKSELSDSEYLQLFKMGHEVADDDGKIVVKKNGQILRDDKTQSPITVKAAIDNMFNERGFIGGQQQQQQGRGGNNNPGGNGSGLKTYSAVEAQWTKDNPGKDLMTGEFQAYLAGHAKEPGFNINA